MAGFRSASLYSSTRLSQRAGTFLTSSINLISKFRVSVAPKAWLTQDSCYLIGWNLEPKNHRRDHGLNEHCSFRPWCITAVITDSTIYLGSTQQAPLAVITAGIGWLTGSTDNHTLWTLQQCLQSIHSTVHTLLSTLQQTVHHTVSQMVCVSEQPISIRLLTTSKLFCVFNFIVSFVTS